LAQREGFQWRLIEEGIRALQHSPFYLGVKAAWSRMLGKISGS
jgi:hypothetical protein